MAEHWRLYYVTISVCVFVIFVYSGIFYCHNTLHITIFMCVFDCTNLLKIPNLEIFKHTFLSIFMIANVNKALHPHMRT